MIAAPPFVSEIVDMIGETALLPNRRNSRMVLSLTHVATAKATRHLPSLVRTPSKYGNPSQIWHLPSLVGTPSNVLALRVRVRAVWR